MRKHHAVRAAGLALLLWGAVALAGERGYFGFGLKVAGGAPALAQAV